MIKVYGDLISGNCHKVQLILELTGKPYEWIHTSIMDRETRTPEYLAMNPNGHVPTLDLGGDNYLAESNAILFYLAQGSDFWPNDARAQAEVLKWMFFEQNLHEPYIASSIFKVQFLEASEELDRELAAAQPTGYGALNYMEQQLAGTAFMTGPDATIADIALFAYTQHAEDGGFSLADYPAIRAWLARVEALPGFVAMPPYE